jgi:vancomycin resistance protein YoaR
VSLDRVRALRRQRPRPRVVRSRRRPPARSRNLRRLVLPLVGLLGAVALLIGLAFAGSPAKLADGVRIGGVDVGGLTPTEAEAVLQARSTELESTPVTFTAPGHTWRLRPRALGVKVDWGAAVTTAERQGRGLGPFRGLRRLEIRVLGADVAPPVEVYDAALQYELDRFSRSVARGHREAQLRLRGLRPVVVPGHAGRKLDRRAASTVIVRALAGFSRTPVALPVHVVAPRVTAAELEPAARQVRTALSSPIRLTLGPTRWRLPRWRIAQLLELPRDGRTGVRIGGAAADAWFRHLRHTIDRPPRDADFDVATTPIRIIPERPGRAVDVAATAHSLLRAALSHTARNAPVTVAVAPAKRTVAEARAMGITSRITSYETIYGGEPNRIHNVQLVAHLVDRQLIAPGATFSFNGATGERSAAKGFKEAPVIINGELQTGLGGGVCQVSTTVFNAAYEAGLKITERTNHALYISHYPLGRDATVNYPDVDLKFVNDTARWLLVRTFVGSSSLVVSLYGAPIHRRVESENSALRVTGPPVLKRVPDQTLDAGETVLEDSGEPSRATSVRRKVFDASGKLIYNDFWSSSYRSEPRIVRYGTKPKPKTTTTTTTETTTTTSTTPKRKPPARHGPSLQP